MYIHIKESHPKICYQRIWKLQKALIVLIYFILIVPNVMIEPEIHYQKELFVLLILKGVLVFVAVILEVL